MSYQIDPMRIASDPLFAGGGALASALFERLVAEGEEKGITRHDVGYAWVAACGMYDQMQAALDDEPDQSEVLNVTAEFLPQRGSDTRPMLRIGGVQVHAYWDDGMFRVNVVTEDCEHEPHLAVEVNDSEVWTS